MCGKPATFIKFYFLFQAQLRYVDLKTRYLKPLFPPTPSRRNYIQIIKMCGKPATFIKFYFLFQAQLRYVDLKTRYLKPLFCCAYQS